MSSSNDALLTPASNSNTRHESRRRSGVAKSNANGEVSTKGNNNNGKDLGHNTTIRGESVVEKPKEMEDARKELATLATVSYQRRRKHSSRPETPKWQTVLSVATKLCLLILGLVWLGQMILKLSNGNSVNYPFAAMESDGRITEVEAPTRRPTSSAGVSTLNTSSRFPSVGRISSTTTRNPAAPSSRPSSPGPRPRNPAAPSARPSSPGPRPRNPASSASRPSSPGPRPRAPVRPIDLPDFPVDAPPNLRTKLPERPASAGRTRPGMGLTVRASDVGVPATAAAAAPASSNRRNYMPVMSKGRLPENPPRATAKLHGNNCHEVAAATESQKISSDGGMRRPAKPVSATDSTGFGRTISKKSLDMALRHMDIRQGMGSIRASSLFPQSIRSTATKGQPARKSDPGVPLAHDEATLENGSWNGTISPDCRSCISIAHSENGGFAAASQSPDRESLATRDSELDLHGTPRYDAFMLNDEDSKNMSWLHSAEDKPGQSPVFDHRFEPLPEPFGLL